MAEISTVLTPWQGLRSLLLVGALALGFGLSIAIFAEGNYARPLCEAYGREHQLMYLRFQYPPSPIGSAQAANSCYCIFWEAAVGRRVDVDFSTIAPNYATYLLVDLATTPVMTVPIFFVVFALGLVGVYGALGIKLRRAGRAE